MFGQTKEEINFTCNQHCASTVLPLLIQLRDFFHQKKYFVSDILVLNNNNNVKHAFNKNMKDK